MKQVSPKCDAPASPVRWDLLVLLVAVGVVSRLAKEYGLFSAPNLHAVAATALFAGFYFRSRAIATLVPISAMLFTDALIGGYHPLVMASVYGCLLVPVFASRWLTRGGSFSLVRLGVTTLGSSLLFFVVTNFATWCTPMYAHTWAGLVQCFTAAIPFWRYTLLGDLAYTGLLFGVYATARCWVGKPSLSLAADAH